MLISFNSGQNAKMLFWGMKCVAAVTFVALATALLDAYALPQSKPKSSQNQSKQPAASDSAHSSRTRHARKRKAHAAGPSYQLHPDPERYQEIQKALADRGYFKGESNGQWGDDSTDALRRFQTDQKLPDDGKINALTLEALGLGPKHDGSGSGSKAPATANNPALATPAPPAPPAQPAPPK